MTKLRFNSVKPSTESPHGSNRCHARLRYFISSSVRLVISYFSNRSLSMIMCKESIVIHGSCPFLTRSIDGAYPALHSSANADQSIKKPFLAPSSCISLDILVRQSTTVPKTSKVSARGFLML